MPFATRCFLLLAAAALVLPGPVRGAEEERTWSWGRDRVYDLRHVDLNLHLDPRRVFVRGKAELTLRSLRAGLDRIPLDLVDLTVDQVRRPRGPRLEHTHREGLLEVRLEAPLEVGEETTVIVEYHGRPTKGLYWVQPDEAYPDKSWQIWSQSEMEDARYWWPTWDFPNDQATSSVHVTVPREFTAVSNGALLRVQDQERGRRTWHWEMETPHVTYLTSLAVGRWEEASEEWDGIPLHYYVPPGRGRDLERTFSDTPDMMAYFSEITGLRYPFPRYSQVAVSDFLYGGMENITATTLTEDTLHDARAHNDSPSTGLVAHELAHQWFGNLMTCESWAHTWLNEGFATYFAALYIGHKDGRDAFLRRVDGMRRGAVRADQGKGRRPVVAWRYRDPFDLFDGHAYQKGGMVLHMLRDLLGDEAFFRAIRRYVSERAGTTVDTDDFQDAVEASTGRALEWFFRQWLHRPGQPDVKASWKWEDRGEGRGEVRISLEQTQNDPEEEPPFRFPLTVRFLSLSEEGSLLREDRRVEIRDRDEDLVFPRPRRPDAVILDPEGSVLMTLEMDRSREESLFLLRRGGNALVRAGAAEALGAEPPPHLVVPALIAALEDDGDHGVRSAAARALGRQGGEEAAAALRAAARREPDSRTRRDVATALGDLSRSEATGRELRRLLERDESYAVRAAAARSLGRLLDEEAWPSLRRALRQESHREQVRSAALSAAAAAHIKPALEEARHWMERGHPSRARRAALDALGRLGWEREPAERRPLAREVERILREDPDIFVQAAAATALGRLGLASSREALKRASRMSPHPRVRGAAERGLEQNMERSAEGADRGDLLRRIEAMEEEQGELRRELERLEGRVDASAPQEMKAAP